VVRHERHRRRWRTLHGHPIEPDIERRVQDPVRRRTLDPQPHLVHGRLALPGDGDVQALDGLLALHAGDDAAYRGDERSQRRARRGR